LTPAGWWFDAVLLLALIGLTLLLAGGVLLDLDIAIRDWVDASRPPVAYWISRGLWLLGQGTPLALITLGIALLCARREKSLRPVIPVVAAFLLIMSTVGMIKIFTDRGTPHHGAVGLFTEADQESYLSGHAVNAIVWYGVIVTLLASRLKPVWRRLLRYAPAVLVAIASVYLAFHWLTDTIAGIFLGLLIDRMLIRLPWRTMPVPEPLERFFPRLPTSS